MGKFGTLSLSLTASLLGMVSVAGADLRASTTFSVPATVLTTPVVVCEDSAELWARLDKLLSEKEYAEGEKKKFNKQLSELEDKIAADTRLTGPGSDIALLAASADLDLPGKIEKLKQLKEKGLRDTNLENEIRLLETIQASFEKLLKPTDKKAFLDLKALYSSMERERRGLVAAISMCSEAVSLIDEEISRVHALIAQNGNCATGAVLVVPTF